MFRDWADEWMRLAAGPHAIKPVLSLWAEPIPGEWKRGLDLQLVQCPPYRRGNVANPRRGEHRIEYEILVENFETLNCLGWKMLDCLNAFPLVRDSAGRRRGNVEADLCGIASTPHGLRLVIAEIKCESNDAWYGAIELLRQMRLLKETTAPLEVFRARNPDLDIGQSPLPTTGLVLAPASFYFQTGKKTRAVAQARALLEAFADLFGVKASLATWDATAGCIAPFTQLDSAST